VQKSYPNLGHKEDVLYIPIYKLLYTNPNTAPKEKCKNKYRTDKMLDKDESTEGPRRNVPDFGRVFLMLTF